MLDVDRRQILAHRIHAHGLHRRDSAPDDLRVLRLGVQDNQRDAAALALAARLPDPPTAEALTADPRFTLAWTHRGAPHLHRTEDLRGLALALLPLSEADAEARMGWQRARVAEAGMPATQALLQTAKAIRAVVDRPMTKGAVSTEVTRAVPAGLSTWCRGCGVTHILEQVMRLAAIHAGVRLVPGATPATLAPIEKRPRPRGTPDVAGATGIVERYLGLHGPATAASAAGFLGTAAGRVKAMWPDDLVEVHVAGKKTFLPARGLPELENPPEPDVVRLLPPSDPYLQARDRELLVPEKGHRTEIWKVLGNPGAILAEGELAGTWRTKASGTRLTVTVSPLWMLSKATRDAIEVEAQRVAGVRGFDRVDVRY